jgi:hypothetical protein
MQGFGKGISEILKKFKGLKCLDARGNWLVDDDAIPIYEAFKQNLVIDQLNLRSNKFSEETLKVADELNKRSFRRVILYE